MQHLFHIKSIAKRGILLLSLICYGFLAQATLSVTISGPATVCQGSSATYTANITDVPGNSPYTYQWKKNGTIVTSDIQGLPSNMFGLNPVDINNNDVITCTVHSSNGLVANSNSITIILTQALSFMVSPAPTNITSCQGAAVNFTVISNSPINSYQWAMNGVVQSTTASTFTTTANSLAQLQSVSVTATTSASCVANTTATGTAISVPFIINPIVTPSVSITQSSNPIREGNPVNFTATPVNGGASPTFQWQLNGANTATTGSWTTSIAGATTQTVSLVMNSNATCAQNPATANITIQIVPVDWENLNYVRVHNVLVAGATTELAVGQLPIGQKEEKTTYLDGLGRAIQKLDKSASFSNGAWVDLVQPIVYDPAGRSTQQYLPYPTTDNPGTFKSANVFSEQASFVTGKFGEPATAPTYAQVQYDNSPLNRVTANFAPGQSWGGNGVGTRIGYDLNTVTENVHIWNIPYTAGAIPTTSPTAVFAAATLYKTISTDEKGKQVITYTDFSGNTILKKVQDLETGAGLTGQHAGWACTYYVYDDLNQLRFLITPKAVAYLDNNGWALTQQLVNDLCFVYGCDAKGRAISKKQPGIGEMDIVYDQKNRPVFTQDANGRNNNQWQGSLYDGLDRVTSTGILPMNISSASLQSYEDANTGNATVTRVTTASGFANISVSQRQAGIREYVASNSISFIATSTTSFVTEAGASFIAFIDPNLANTVNEVVDLPDNSIPSSGFITLTQTYYDDYSHAGKTYTTADNGLFDPSTNQQAQPLPTQPYPQTRGMITTMKVKVISNPADLTQGNWQETDSYYDNQGHLIQTQNDNALGGTDIVTNRYDFAGKLWGSCVKHMAGSPTQFTVVSKNSYDQKGRLTDISKNFNSTFFKDLATYSYDEYGKLINKILAPGYTGSGSTQLETLAFTYNIQGWLTGINKPYAQSTNTYDQWGHYFGVYLGYDNADNQFAGNQFNGSITGTIWRSQGDNAVRKYDYTYDNLGRFTSGIFHQEKTPSAAWSTSDVDLSENVSYTDDNGNIGTMKHMGIVPGMKGGVVIDNLVYNYGTAANPNTNQLSRVDEGATIPGNGQLFDFHDGTNAAGTNDYTYDANGNLVQDLNKGITDGSSGGVVYNFLDKPVSITIAGKSLIQYTYDATGLKQSKKVTNLAVTPNTSTTTTYDDEFVYQDNNLQYVLHEEGRMKIITAVNTPQIQLNAGSGGANNVQPGKQGVFEYFVKDQLSNTRMVLTEEAQKETYIATMETSSGSDPNLGADEESLFGQVDPNTGSHASNELLLTRTHTPGTWTGNTSAQVVDLTAANTAKKMGPNMILKVSAGDMINAGSQYFYITNDPSGSSNGVTDALSSLLAAMLDNKTSALTKINSTQISTNLSASGGDFSNFITGLPSQGANPNAPKAYLNILFFDEQFNFIAQDVNAPNVGSNFQRVSNANTQNANLMLQQKAPKNGWVFIYLSNESNQDVYFDNFSVSQVHGAISEENHYYAFGQKIGGICTKAFNKLPNKYNYQGDFSEEEENTGWDEFDLRMYDPQIGRWTGADPYDEFASPYVGMGDDPVNNVDEDGGDIEGPGPLAPWGTIQDFYQKFIVPHGFCILCESESNAETLASFTVTATKAAGPAFMDYVNIFSRIQLYMFQSEMNSGREKARKLLVQAGGVEIGALHAATFGAVPLRPIFSDGYTDEDMKAFYGAALAGQIIPSLAEGSALTPNSGLQVAPVNGEPLGFNFTPTLPSFSVNASGTNANNLPESRTYDRPNTEIISGKAVRQKDVLNDWNDFLGPNQTNIDPRDGLPDPDRIWSADGKRSIRFGDHESGNPNPNKWHYHKETWYPNLVSHILQRVQR